MGFIFNNSAKADPRPPVGADVTRIPQEEARKIEINRFYGDLMARRPRLLDEKLKLHGRIIDEFNLDLLEKLSPEELHRQIQAYVAKYIRAERISLNQKELETFTGGARRDDWLWPDRAVAQRSDRQRHPDQHPQALFRRALWQARARQRSFKDEAHLLRIINKIVSGIGRRVDESSPMVDARLPDGSRVNVAIRPVAVDGPMVSIRKFAERPYNIERLVEIGALCPAMAEMLQRGGAGPNFADNFRWNWNRQDHIAQCPVGFHS